MKHKVVRVKMPRAGEINTIRLGQKHYPAVRVSRIQRGDMVYDVGSPPMPVVPPIKVRVVAVVPTVKSQNLHIHHPAAGAIEVRRFHPASYVPVPMTTYKKYHPGGAKVPQSKHRPSREMTRALDQAREVGRSAMRPKMVRVPPIRIPKGPSVYG